MVSGTFFKLMLDEITEHSCGEFCETNPPHVAVLSGKPVMAWTE
jgi:hypothetical protein